MHKYALCTLAVLGLSLVAAQPTQASNWQVGVSGANYGFTAGSYNRGYNNSPSFRGGNYGYGNSGYGNSGYGHSNYGYGNSNYGYGNSNYGNYGYGNNYGRSNHSYYSQPNSGNYRCH